MWKHMANQLNTITALLSKRREKLTGPRLQKNFIFDSAEHKIYPAHKC